MRKFENGEKKECFMELYSKKIQNKKVKRI